METDSPFFSLAGRTALVTGAGQGIGLAIARRLSAAGARVGVFDLSAELADRAARDLDGIPLAGNVAREEDVARAVEEFTRSAGGIDILVNNAGVLGKIGPVAALQLAEFQQTLEINLLGPFLCIRAVLPEMVARRFGRIINVASIAGKEGNPNLVPYSVSKAGLIALTKSVAKEVATAGDVTVNAISPAVIQTPMMDAMPQATQDYMVSRVPLGRPGRSEEVAALVHYLASPEASFTTGQCYDISGGRATY